MTGTPRRSARLPLLALLPALLAACGTLASTPASPSSSAAASSPPSPGSIADVSTYRGGNGRTGQMPGPGPSAEPAPLWSHAFGPGGIPQPLLVDGLVIGISPAGEVIGLDARSGEPRLKDELGAGVASQPAADAGALYVVTQDGVLHARTLADGTERWQAPGYDEGTMIAVSDGIVLAGTPTGLVARRASDGAQAWAVPLGSVTQIAVDGGRAYLSGGSTSLTIVDLATGAVVADVGIPAAELLTPTALPEGVIVAYRDVSGRTNGVSAFDADGAQRWTFREPDSLRIDSAVVSEDTVFVITDVPFVVDALDRATGELRWRQRLDDESVSAGAVADGILYAVGAHRGLITIDRDRNVGWELNLGETGEPGRLLVSGGLVIWSGTRPGPVATIGVLAVPQGAPASREPSPPTPSTAPSPSLAAGVTVVDRREVGRYLLFPALAPDGTLYALDVDAAAVVAIDPSGHATSWGSKGSGTGQFDWTEVTQHDQTGSVAVSPDGKLVAVGDGGNHRVQLFTPAGEFVRSVGRTGRGQGQFVNSCCVALDGDHRLYVADPGRDDIQVFDSSGDYLFTMGAPGSGDGQVRRVAGLVVDDARGEVLVSDFANRRIAVFAKDGSWLRNVVSDPGSGLILDEVNQVAVDPFGRLFILDTTNRISIIDQDGHLAGTVPGSLGGGGVGEYLGFALDPTGRLLLADPMHQSIVEVQLAAPLWPGAVP